MSSNFFEVDTPTEVGTNDVCAKYKKNCGKDFLNFFGEFLNIMLAAASSLVVLYLTAYMSGVDFVFGHLHCTAATAYYKWSLLKMSIISLSADFLS